MFRPSLAAAAVVAVLVLGGALLLARRGPARDRRSEPDAQCERQPEPARRRWSKRDAHRDAQPHAHAAPVDRGEPEGGLARARRDPSRSERRDPRAVLGRLRSVQRPGSCGRHRVRRPSCGSTSGWWTAATGRSSSSNSSITTRRSWIPPSNGSHTAWSSMTTATASPTGDTGSTTCPSTRRMGGTRPGVAVRTSTPAERTASMPDRPYGVCDRTLIRRRLNLLRHLLPARGVRAGGRADLLWRRPCRWRHGPRAGRPLLRLGIGDRRWPRRGHGLCALISGGCIRGRRRSPDRRTSSRDATAVACSS